MKYLKRFNEDKSYERIEHMFKEYLIELVDKGFNIIPSRNFLRIRKYSGIYKYKWDDVKDEIIKFMYAFQEDFNIKFLEVFFEKAENRLKVTYGELEDFESDEWIFSIDIKLFVSNEYIDIDYEEEMRKREEW